jgi:hypothetical protein
MQALVSISDTRTRANIATAEMAQRERLAAIDAGLKREQIRLDQEFKKDANTERNATIIEQSIARTSENITKAYAPMLATLQMAYDMARTDKEKATAKAAYEEKLGEIDRVIASRTSGLRARLPESQLSLVSVTPAPTR